ncbi:glycosyltransferase family 2 protein [Hyaloraphidium curvatum]|nr:glycosyltransferase family 2 protein [Hyaloraphidium curvatum]
MDGRGYGLDGSVAVPMSDLDWTSNPLAAPFAPVAPRGTPLAADGPGAGSPAPALAAYAPVPPREPRRYAPITDFPKRSVTTKKIPLTEKGNLQIDLPVPTDVLNYVSMDPSKEFTHMRYTAVTCDPNDFDHKGYTLRPVTYERKTELFIVVTMYNEAPQLFINTMHAITTNVKNFMARESSQTWGEDAWQKIVICVVADGADYIHTRTRDLLALMGCYQDGVMKTKFGDEDVTGHLFEYTTQVDLDRNGNELICNSGPPVQMMFLIKQQNTKKINSHRWFFNAFCPVLNPKVTMLIDVGTRPLDTSLYYLWKVFDRHPNVGGACGEIRADIGTGWYKCFTNWLVAVQNFEYKMSNILDKPLESSFGYISVLPGAFSAYRYEALKSLDDGTGPLASYFLGEDMHSGKVEGGVFKNNMYLAEDRILCFELVAKRGQSWTLRYERRAAGVTDVIEEIPELLKQRRRWLNGSNFAAFYALLNWGRIWKSSHSTGRKIVFMLEWVYQLLVMLFSWFSIANFFLAFYFLMEATVPQTLSTPGGTLQGAYRPPFYEGSEVVFQVFTWIYVLLMLVQLIISLGNSPNGSVNVYRFLVIPLWVLIMAIILALIGSNLYFVFSTVAQPGVNVGQLLLSSPNFQATILGLGCTFGLWILASILFLDPWHMVTCFLQYLLLMPFWVNVLQTYAMCNTNDVSWGTKGDTEAPKHDADNAVKLTGPADGREAEFSVPDASKKDEANAIYRALLAESQTLNDKDRKDESPEGKEKEAKKKAEAEKKAKEEYAKMFRTNVVLCWVFSNLALIVVLTNPRIKQLMTVPPPVENPNLMGFSGYLDFLFWSTLFFSLVKFLGAMWYLCAQQWFDRKDEDAKIENALAQRPNF